MHALGINESVVEDCREIGSHFKFIRVCLSRNVCGPSDGSTNEVRAQEAIAARATEEENLWHGALHQVVTRECMSGDKKSRPSAVHLPW